jgi:cellobiose phosphorylase
MLGIRAELDGLRIEPCLPDHWDGFEAKRRFRGMEVQIEVKNPDRVQSGVKRISVDGSVIDSTLVPIDQLSDGCRIEVLMG